MASRTGSSVRGFMVAAAELKCCVPDAGRRSALYPASNCHLSPATAVTCHGTELTAGAATERRVVNPRRPRIPDSATRPWDLSQNLGIWVSGSETLGFGQSCRFVLSLDKTANK